MSALVRSPPLNLSVNNFTLCVTLPPPLLPTHKSHPSSEATDGNLCYLHQLGIMGARHPIETQNEVIQTSAGLWQN